MISLKKEKKEKQRTAYVVTAERASSFQPWFLYIKWLFTKTSAVQKLCAWVKRASKRKTNTSNHGSDTIYIYLQYKTSQKLNQERGYVWKNMFESVSSENTSIRPTATYNMQFT